MLPVIRGTHTAKLSKLNVSHLFYYKSHFNALWTLCEYGSFILVIKASLLEITVFCEDNKNIFVKVCYSSCQTDVKSPSASNGIIRVQIGSQIKKGVTDLLSCMCECHPRFAVGAWLITGHALVL